MTPENNFCCVLYIRQKKYQDMNCNKYRIDLISESGSKAFEAHLAECEVCRALYQKVNETMAVLEEPVSAPDHLAASIMAGREEVSFPKQRKLYLSSFIQIAAAIIFGIFIGHKFGKIAGSHITRIKQDPINEYFKAHHFNVDKAAFKAPSLYIKNQND